jgi:hypothetical protein
MQSYRTAAALTAVALAATALSSLWGDTAVVTAKLLLKGTREGTAFDRKLWFSDTYVRTPRGWRYVFGQASIALPPENKAANL